MAYKMLNSIFYKDLADIIVSYNMIDINLVKYHKYRALVMFMGRWRICESVIENIGISQNMTSIIYLTELKSLGVGNRYKHKKTFKLN